MSSIDNGGGNEEGINGSTVTSLPSHVNLIMQSIKDWGCSPLPPTVLATLLTALHFRPFQAFPMTFPPVLLLTSYVNLQDLTKESAGLSATCSGLYLLMDRRRKEKNIKRRGFTARGLTRSVALGLASINFVSGGLTYYGYGKEVNESVV